LHPAINNSQAAEKGMFLISADLDKLKEINDTHGHAEGDRALSNSPISLKTVFENQTSSRVLAVMSLSYSKSKILQRHRKWSLHVFSETLNYVTERRARYKLSISLGIAHCLQNTDYTINNLLIKADKLMYEQKALKRHI